MEVGKQCLLVLYSLNFSQFIVIFMVFGLYFLFLKSSPLRQDELEKSGWLKLTHQLHAQIKPETVFFNTTLAFLSFYAAFSFFLWLLFPKMVTSNTGCFRIRNAIGAKTKFKMADCQFAAIRSAKQGWEEISGGHRNLDPQIVYLHITIPNVLMT